MISSRSLATNSQSSSSWSSTWAASYLDSTPLVYFQLVFVKNLFLPQKLKKKQQKKQTNVVFFQIINYSTRMFQAKFNEAKYLTLGVGAANVAFTLVAVSANDRANFKPKILILFMILY